MRNFLNITLTKSKLTTSPQIPIIPTTTLHVTVPFGHAPNPHCAIFREHEKIANVSITHNTSYARPRLPLFTILSLNRIYELYTRRFSAMSHFRAQYPKSIHIPCTSIHRATLTLCRSGTRRANCLASLSRWKRPAYVFCRWGVVVVL